MNKHRFHIRNIKITGRLFIAFCGLVLLVVMIISLAQFYWYTKDTKAKIGDYAIDNLTQITISIGNSLSRLDDYYLEIANGSVVQTSLSENPSQGSIEYMNNQFRFREAVVQKYSFFKYIKNIYVLSADFLPVLSYTSIYRDSNLDEQDIRKIAENDKETLGERSWKALDGDSQIGGQGKRKDSLVLHSLIYPMWGKGIAGYMAMEVRTAFFLDAFSQPQSGKGIETFLLDEEGVIIASFDPVSLPIGKKYSDPKIMDKIKANPQYFQYDYQNQSGMLAYVPVEHTNLYAVSVIPESYFKSASYNMKKITIISSLIFLILSGIITIVITRSIHIPLKQLTMEMDQVRQGDFRLSTEDGYHDEISEIKQNFSYMVKEVERLTLDIVSRERQMKQAEIAALQAQINPHFLSNTLGSIQWMAELQGAKNIEDITGSLIHLLHLCVRKGSTWITMKEEVEYLRCYINVQKYRYLDKFEVIFDIEEAICQVKVPQFILQPVLENAIIHGIAPMTGQGLITVSAKAGSRLVVVILDSGVGMSEGKTNSMFDSGGIGKANFNNIGLKNIRERLVLYYGEDFLFEIESKEGTYTRVVMELPYTRGE